MRSKIRFIQFLIFNHSFSIFLFLKKQLSHIKNAGFLPQVGTILLYILILLNLLQIFYYRQCYLAFFLQQYRRLQGQKMQKAPFSHTTNKISKLRLKIENQKSRILKEEEQGEYAIKTFTLVPTHNDIFSKNKENSLGKDQRISREHVRFRLDKSKTIHQCQLQKDGEGRVDRQKQPRPKILKSFSTSKAIKLNKLHLQQNQFPEEPLEQKNQNSLFGDIIEVLKSKFVLLEFSSLNYSIKKEQFVSLLTYIASSLIFCQNSKVKKILNDKFPHFSCLEQKAKALQYRLKEEMKEASNCLAIESNVFKLQYTHHNYFEDQLTMSNKLIRTAEELSQISKELALLKEDRIDFVKMMKSLKIQLSEHLKQKVQVQTQVYQLKDVHRQLQMEIQNKKCLINSINEEADNLFNYLNNNRCKVIERISTQYKQIQTEMRDYALFLQSNHMASQIGYQPRRFGQIEEVIVDEMKRINKTIIQDVQILPQLKQKLMRNFILRAMDKFKSKDTQMSKLNDFKTKCIRAYIENIKKWLENWTLKQQYLANMRKQFIYDSQRLTEKISRLKQISQQYLLQQGKSLIEDIYGISEKIIENYKLGNSFY